MEAFGLPKNTDSEKAKRSEAIQEATKYAISIPYETMVKAYESMEICEAMVLQGNPNSITDGSVGALCARSAIIGAELNVRINAVDLKDRAFADDMLKKASALRAKAIEKEASILKATEAKI
jgi:glutamate formiminotransferase/formiminotetrahydrofolate cyclodeaminase